MARAPLVGWRVFHTDPDHGPSSSERDQFVRTIHALRRENALQGIHHHIVGSESVEWLNQYMEYFWLKHEPRLSQLIVDRSIAPTLNSYSGDYIKAVTLNEFTLGSRAPRVEDVSTSVLPEDDKIQLVFRLKMRPRKDSSGFKSKAVQPRFVIRIHSNSWFIPSITAAVNELSITCLVCLTVNLMESFPHLRNVQLSLLEEPVISFRVSPVHKRFNIMKIPFIDGRFRKMVTTSLTRLQVLSPEAYTVYDNLAPKKPGSSTLYQTATTNQNNTTSSAWPEKPQNSPGPSKNHHSGCPEPEDLSSTASIWADRELPVLGREPVVVNISPTNQQATPLIPLTATSRSFSQYARWLSSTMMQIIGETHSVSRDLWMQTEPLNRNTIVTVPHLRLSTFSRDKNSMGRLEDGVTWSWFEIVILDSRDKSIRMDPETGNLLLWKSHHNASSTVCLWYEGDLFGPEHPLWEQVKEGDVIGVCACAQYGGINEAQAGILEIWEYAVS